MKCIRMIFCGLLTTLVLSCATQNSHILGEGNESQLQLRQIQTKHFEISDKNFVLRSVISTMQDTGFVIDKADDDVGVISGTKLMGRQSTINMTVTVKLVGNTTHVRVNARHSLDEIKDPKLYQDFFSLLSKSIFLSKNNIN